MANNPAQRAPDTKAASATKAAHGATKSFSLQRFQLEFDSSKTLEENAQLMFDALQQLIPSQKDTPNGSTEEKEATPNSKPKTQS